MNPHPLLQVCDLTKHFPITRGVLNRQVGTVRAVDGVSFDVHEGECLGLVGESGSGKTTVGRCILRALNPTSGQILFAANGDPVDMATVAGDELRSLRRHIQLIFQDPYGSLNPRMTISDIVGEPLLVHGLKDRQQREARVRVLLAQVGLNPAHMLRYPHAFSGGQRQRIGIARGLALRPRLIVADEPVSALDVSVQAQILNLLQQLQADLGLTYIFIAHDLSVVRHLCDRVAVMYVGRIVELAETEELFQNPQHPYTRALLAAVPEPDPDRRSWESSLQGEIADPAEPPLGCAFHPRCVHTDEGRCREELPVLRELLPRHWVRCHHSEQLRGATQGEGQQR
ncbi:MAG: oligopeptide/dipeptide ABC transporter ATP-binding protein [Candidatus Latescibacterota bacterium]|nr:oligopeptide/dipeptide ABC transporter ATP-binding protein [Candidatus Latescibacterota bacterium]